ncbi:type I-E CRISPR-associated protein Cas5/CasD [Enemella sp. A6]|uniref:type I-E CRISPR-associated protein Cas5/CasD n=1 Tax=Enemella sp. A6 TaxID=3440152 RepID=UPI003EBE8732
MSVLILRLAGPLQSWGAASRFNRRATEPFPTKSGIVGLLAAAQGRRRADEIEDLLGLELAVRTDQRGQPLRDFHTAHHPVSGAAMPLTERFYWSDAVFTAYVGGPDPVLEGLDEALRDPRYPLYLGRRSCVPEGRMVLGRHEGDVATAVRETPWAAGFSGRRKAAREVSVRLPVQADVSVFAGEQPSREINDVPLSFDPHHRQYRSRMVVETHVVVPTGNKIPSEGVAEHDPMALLGGAS